MGYGAGAGSCGTELLFFFLLLVVLFMPYGKYFGNGSELLFFFLLLVVLFVPYSCDGGFFGAAKKA